MIYITQMKILHVSFFTIVDWLVGWLAGLLIGWLVVDFKADWLTWDISLWIEFPPLGSF